MCKPGQVHNRMSVEEKTNDAVTYALLDVRNVPYDDFSDFLQFGLHVFRASGDVRVDGGGMLSWVAC